jgi:hypothetical protein
MVRGGRGWQSSSVFTFNLLLLTFFADGTFTLREEGEACTSVFAGKNDALRLDSSRFSEDKS